MSEEKRMESGNARVDGGVGGPYIQFVDAGCTIADG